MLIETGFETEMTDLVVERGFHTSKWTIGNGGSVATIGPVKDGVVYFGCCDNYIYALDADTGEEIWRFKASGVFGESRPIIHENFLLTGNYDGYLYVIDIRNGELAWKFKTGDRITASASVNNKDVYIGSWDGYLYVLGLADGREKARFRLGNKIGAGALIREGRIYVGCFDGNFYCMDMNGRDMWRLKTGGCIFDYHPPTFHQGRIYVGSYDGYLYCLSPDGRLFWKFKTGEAIVSSATIHGNRIYFGSHDNNAYCLDMDGREIWRFKCGKWVGDVKLMVEEGIVYFGSVDSNFYAVDAETGKMIWKFRTGGDVWSDAFLHNRLVVFGSWDCHVYALDAKTGEESWRFETSSKQQSPLDITDEVVVRPEFADRDAGKRSEGKKYDLSPQVNISESMYNPVIEYAVKDIYGAGKKKYEEKF